MCADCYGSGCKDCMSKPKVGKVTYPGLSDQQKFMAEFVIAGIRSGRGYSGESEAIYAYRAWKKNEELCK